jgi:ribosomal protein S12 methylthiotransferase
MKIGVISLGCDKNRVDTEKMLARLLAAGHTLVTDEAAAEVLIINTCAFTDEAKKESVGEIFRAIELKNKNGAKVIVTGCLTERYRGEILSEIPEIDAALGVSNYDDISKAVEGKTRGKTYFSECDKFVPDRVLTTPYHYAYLKIAEGCKNRCTFCAIPSIRGDYRSESIENLVREAEGLEGVKELILVAQDVSRYGVDFDGKPHLIELLDKLSKLPFDWIRLMYLEPEMVSAELIDYVAQNPKICKYMDIPLQHIDDQILRRMNRHSTESSAKKLVDNLKAKNIAVRSSFIAGFPGETEEQFQKLVSFIKDYELDYAGFFAYSREEGTAADKLPDHLPQKVKLRRKNALSALQSEIIQKNNRKMVGKTLKVLYDDINYKKGRFVGRYEKQAPDIDTKILFSSAEPLDIGQFYLVKINGADKLDLTGQTVKIN